MEENTTKTEHEIELSVQALYDIPVQLSIVIGKTTMLLGQLLKLGKGVVIELDRNVGEPIDIYVNNKLVAKGELVIVDNKVGVTLTEVMKYEKQ